MSESTPALLTDVLGQVLQDAAFMLADPAPSPEVWCEPVLSATIAFDSTRRGLLRITTSGRAATEIAANMMGLASDDSEADRHARAALAELLNVIGGTFLTRYFGSHVPSQLELPAVVVGVTPTRRSEALAAVKLENGEPLVLELEFALP